MIDCNITTNYFNEKKRMCNSISECIDCPLRFGNDCTGIEKTCPTEAILKVQKWSNEHPQETYFTELLRNYPNVELNGKGFPEFCPCKLGYQIADEICSRNACNECWNLPIDEGEK